MQREGQARQGCLKCVPKVSHGCETKKHTQTLTLRIFLQFITTAYKLQTPNLAYKHFAGFAKCSKSLSPLPPLEKGEVARLIQIFRLLYSIQIVLPLQFWNYSEPWRWGLLPIRTINEIFRTIPSPRTKLASLVKGEVLSPEKIRATTGGIAFLPHPFRFSDTSVNNPSVTVTENTILCQRIFNFYKKQYWKRCASLCQLPLHKGAKCGSASPKLSSNLKSILHHR